MLHLPPNIKSQLKCADVSDEILEDNILDVLISP
jgi:hypothetical protein